MKIGEKMTEEYMKIALEEAKKAYKKEEVPIRGHNRKRWQGNSKST